MDAAAADGAMQPDAMPATDAVEGPIVVKSDVLAEPDMAGALHDQKPVEEVAAAVALVGDKRSAEAETRDEQGSPSKRMAV
jgi:hypothetical protein